MLFLAGHTYITRIILPTCDYITQGSNVQGGPKKLIVPTSSSRDGSPVQNQDKVEGELNKQHHTRKPSYEKEESTSTLKTECSEGTSKTTVCNNDEDTMIEHTVQRSDTLQLICLKYGISARDLRKANNFRGTNLDAAPDRLVIPQTKQSQKKASREMTNHEKIQSLQAHAPIDKHTKKSVLSYDEAVSYLDANDWNLLQAVRNMNIDVSDSSEKKPKSRSRHSLLRRASTECKKVLPFN